MKVKSTSIEIGLIVKKPIHNNFISEINEKTYKYDKS